jgi:hypothetical protein
MVSATQWQPDTQLLPQNPFQRIKYYPAWPGGMRAFGWHPVPLTITPVGSPSGFMTTGGISGVGSFLPSATTIFTTFFGLVGAGVGVWLARKNLAR